jgi:hypothetical protein
MVNQLTKNLFLTFSTVHMFPKTSEHFLVMGFSTRKTKKKLAFSHVLFWVSIFLVFFMFQLTEI